LVAKATSGAGDELLEKASVCLRHEIWSKDLGEKLIALSINLDENTCFSPKFSPKGEG